VKFSNSHGSVTLHVEQNIVIAKFSGCVSLDLMQQFEKGIVELTAPIKAQPWGYISDSSSVIAATPDAEQYIVNVSYKMRANNCILSAFVITQAIAKNQTQRILKNSGVKSDLSKRFFDNPDQAKEFIKAALSKT
jgi:hypothetical protein